MTLGDVGYVDDEGYVFLTDRVSNMIISGGVNIYPRETEDVLIGHPAVHDVAVIGVPHPEMGESVRAVVQLAEPADDEDAMAEELRQYCRDHLSHFKCPTSVVFVDELPRLPTGKIAKRMFSDEVRGLSPHERGPAQSSRRHSCGPDRHPAPRRTGSPTTSTSSTQGSPPSARGRWASARATTCSSTATSPTRPSASSASSPPRTSRRATFMASSGYPNELCFYRALRVAGDDPGAALRARRHRRRRLVHAPPRGLVAHANPATSCSGCTVPQVEAAVHELVGLHAPFWDAPSLHEHPHASAAAGSPTRACSPKHCRRVVPGFVERYGHAFAPDEVDFYERLATSARGWIEARPASRSLVHSDYRPDNLMFGTDADGRPTVAAVDWQGFGRGCAMSDVSFIDRQRAHRRRPSRQRGAHRARLPRGARRGRRRRLLRSPSAGTSTGARCSRR